MRLFSLFVSACLYNLLYQSRLVVGMKIIIITIFNGYNIRTDHVIQVEKLDLILNTK